MVRLARLIKPCLSLVALSLLSAQSMATTLVADTTGRWNLFDVDATLALDNSNQWIDATFNPDAGLSGDGSPLQYLIATSKPQYLTLVDGGVSGDRYWLNLDGVSLLSGAAVDMGAYQGLDFTAALADPSFSKGTWLVPAGLHFLTGGLHTSATFEGQALNASVGAFRLTDVPLPPSAGLLGGSLALWVLAWLRRRRAAASLALMAGLTPALTCQAVEPAGTWVKLVAFNDFHGQLESPGSLRTNAASATPSLPVGGVDWMAAYVANLKAQNPRTLVVSAGDIIGATPLVSALFHDEPTIEAMNRLGLDFNAVGNHEFDEGKDELLRMQQGGCHPTDANSCKGAQVGTPVPFEGAKFKFLAANVQDSSSGKTLFPPYAIKQWGNLRLALIGMTLKDTPSIVTPSGVAGLSFKDEAATVNALVPQLRARGVNAIVVLLHQGGTIPVAQAADTINSCAGNLAGTPIPAIVSGLDDAVDLVITGHTHQAYNCKLPNRAGRAIAVTSANSQGRVLTDINLQLDNTGEVVAVNAQNLVVDRSRTDLVPNNTLQSLVASYKNLATPIANRVIGEITAAMAHNSANAAGEIALGDVLADAQLAATQAAQNGGALVAFMNPGGIRSPGFTFASSAANEGDGKVTYGEAFSVQPFGNTLVTLSVTGEQLRILLEQQFTGCNAATAPASFNYPAGDTGQSFDRVLQVSAGFSYRWNPTAPVCQKVDAASISINGQPVLPESWYRITVNNFLADGGDKFYVLPKGKDRLGGAQDIDALEAWFNNPAADSDASKPGVQVAPGPQNRIALVP
ncbi:MAG: bifunctional metallophosphatase/5'-nucleotidase [Marinagarivorans sp.]